MVPAAVLQRDGEDVHDGMIERLAAGLRVHLLRIVGAGADHEMRVMAGVDDDASRFLRGRRSSSRMRREIDQRLALIFGAECSLVYVSRIARFGSPFCGQRHGDIRALGPPSSQAIKPSSPS